MCGAGRAAPRVLVRQLRLQHLPEKRVDAEAPGRPRRLLDEGVGVRQPGEDAPDVGATAQPVHQVRPQLRGHAGAQQHAADARRLPLEDLGEEVLGHSAVVAGEGGDQLLRRHALLQGGRGEPEADRPALGLRAESPRHLHRHGHAHGGEQFAGLLRGEAQLVAADLRERPREPVPVDGELRVGAAAHHQPQPAARVTYEEIQAGHDGPVGEVVGVVDDQHDGPWACGDVRGQSGHEAAWWWLPRDHRRHLGQLDAGSRQGLEDVAPEDGRLVVVVVQGQPADGPSGSLALPPRVRQHGLPRTGRTAEESQRGTLHAARQ